MEIYMNWNDLLSGDRIRTFQKSTTSRDLRTEFEKDYSAQERKARKNKQLPDGEIYCQEHE